MNLLELFHKGGFMMPVLALLSVITVLMILLYLVVVRRNAVVSDRFMANAETLIRKNDFTGLIGYCERQNESMARIVQRAAEFMAENGNASFSDVRDVAEAEGSRQASQLTSRVSYLADIGAIAPMLGLLGTVVGMIKSFLHVSQGGFQGARQMAFAGGVSEALITTASGLAVGVPALIFYAIFRARVQNLISELESAATHLIAVMRTQVERSPYAAARSRSSGEFAVPAPPILREDRPDLHGI
jgi:biopolymer transport protein ExbB